MHRHIITYNCESAWFDVLSEIDEYGTIFNVGNGSEEGETKKLSISVEIKYPTTKPLFHCKAPTDNNYINNYFMEYLYFDNDNPNEAYTYGSRLRKPIDQLQAVIDRIIRNPQDRQLTMVIRRPEDIDNKEPPCLSLIDVEVDSKLLSFHCYLRSWDAYAGLPTNTAGLALMMNEIVNEVNNKVSMDKQIQVGTLLLHSKNCHIYKRQYPLVEELLNSKDNSLRMMNKK